MQQGPTDNRALRERLKQLLESSADSEPAPLIEFLSRVRPEDLADLMIDFPPAARIQLFQAVPKELQATVLSETDPSSQKMLAHGLTSDVLIGLLVELDPDDAADFVDMQSNNERESLLRELPANSAEDIRSLMQYAPESAGGIMTSGYLSILPTQSANDALLLLQQTINAEVVTYIYVVDPTHRLEGVVSLRELLIADPKTKIQEFMEKEVIACELNIDQEKVANLARKYNLKSIPVVDHSRKLMGAITIDDLVDVISEEADEDIYRLAGTEQHHPTHQHMGRRTMVRIPWLLLPGISGLVVAGMHDSEKRLEMLALWAFLPLVMGISGAVGTQTSTILVRGMATGEIDTNRLGKVIGQEFLIGGTVALFLGGLASVIIPLIPSLQASGHQLAYAVAMGLFAGIMIATVSGTFLPFLCRAINLDPALAAGPFITSLNDVLAATSFLAIGNVML